MYASVIVEIGVKAVDKTFDYQVPSEFINNIRVGMRVKVPFGKLELEGFVLNLKDKIDNNYELKEIISLVDAEPILTKEMLLMGDFIVDSTLCSKISAYQAMLPKALKAKNKVSLNKKYDKYILLNKDNDEIILYINKCRYDKQKELLNKLLKEKEIKVNTITSEITTLLKHELIKLEEREIYRYKVEKDFNYKEITLNEDQKNVVNKIIEHKNESKTFLLYGVTGSGKTEVYMNVIDSILKDGKTAIMLVPEISLTPQIVKRFINRFGDNVAILHSGLSDGEKYDEYRKIQQGIVKIVVGARSAIFAPLENIGVIVIDEEHTSTYKQEDSNPRYNARDIALWRSKYHKCPVILGSATPSLESFARAGNHVYELLTLTKRPSNSVLPTVHIVDMKEEVKKNNFIFSELLIDKINEKLNKHEQIILLLNRRGYSSMLTCSSCGHVEKCPRCDISLTYHKTSNMLRCHYCGYFKKKIDKCSNCGSTDIKDYGMGTQKLEEELNKYFPSANIIRMDMDTTSKKGAHEQIIKDFGEHKYDILVGTQMIAKGLDFPLVTLVGVMNADMSLSIPDFRSAERTFQLLSQVSGRAGRGNLKGEVIIQTYNNKHYSIVLAKDHNYLAFYKEEMSIRKKLNYPPYYFITLVNISSKDYELGFEHANKIGDYLKNNLEDNTIVLGPTMANMFKINNIYHFQCIIKYRHDNKLKSILKVLDERYKAENKVNVEINVEPTRL